MQGSNSFEMKDLNVKVVGAVEKHSVIYNFTFRKYLRKKLDGKSIR